MNRTITVLFGLLSLGWAVYALGDEPLPAYEHLKPLEWQIGDWTTEYQATADSGEQRASRRHHQPHHIAIPLGDRGEKKS